MKAPWTDEQVKALNAYQSAGQFHPFTCPGNNSECAKHRNLIATNDGWVCACGEYRQDWAHAVMGQDADHDPRASGFGLSGIGAAAFRRGKAIADNPMPEGSRAWEAWRTGWLEASKRADHGVSQ